MISFASPFLLLGLIALPLLWLLLRAMPPAPVLHRFPAVPLLLGLKDKEVEADKTPWWLLLLRALAIAGLIFGFAGPFWEPDGQMSSDRPLLVIVDGTWAEAQDWAVRQDQALSVIDQAGRDGRPVALSVLTDDTAPAFGPAALAARQLGGLVPAAWTAEMTVLADALADIEGPFDTYWIAGPLAAAGQSDLVAELDARGDVTVFETGAGAVALRPATLTPNGVELTLDRTRPGPPAALTLHAIGPDPSGQTRILGMAEAVFDADATTAKTTLDLPAELRDRVARYQIVGTRTAGAITLSDDRLKRREIALVSATTQDQEGLALLSQLHFLRQALVPSSDLLNGAMQDILQANPDTIILADVPSLPDPQAILDWVDQGGLLIRFAGPRLAAARFDSLDDDPLLPVRLRAGGRTVGGAMSWGAPKTLQPFAPDSPFAGLPTPAEVTVSAQVLAEPGPDLAARAIARLDDGTPLVTRETFGQGQIVLFHVTANSQWSNLPLSGLFVSMLERLSIATGQAPLDPGQMEGTIWSQVAVVDGFGNVSASNEIAGIDGADLAAPLSAALPPGLYAGDDRVLARNVVGADDVIAAPVWPSDITLQGPGVEQGVDLKPWVLLAALAFLAVDVVASLALSGKLRGPIAAAITVLALGLPGSADAQSDPDAAVLRAASEVVLAYVMTGDETQDALSRAGLQGLSETLFARTAIEPGAPAGLNLLTDDLSLYPFVYWPITDVQAPLPADARARVNRYLQAGGMILFDTRDGNISGFGAQTAAGRKLGELAQGLLIPRLAPMPDDHVLTRTFYLLQDFPGRHMGQNIWVEASPPADPAADGMPFRNLNDGVTPVVIGGNDWAAAWATDVRGRPMVPVGRGFAGERQRELAYRFGVNVIMHVLTGNYKSDQVHVPELLERLGQ